MTTLSSAVESALAMCGRDRVFHNDGAPPSVAIRRTPYYSMPGDKWLIASGDSHDEAGRKAAAQFADELAREGDELSRQAAAIRAVLTKRAATGAAPKEGT